MNYMENGPSPENDGPLLAGGLEGFPHSSGANAVQDKTDCLLSKLQDHYYKNAHYQSETIALVGAIVYLSGICGRAYNTPTGAGLNNFVLLLAPTGAGKEAVSSGTSKLNQALLPRCPTIHDFSGPGELVSSAGLIKWLDRQPCVLSIVGEIGKLLKMMAHPNASQHYKSLYRTLLQLYSKSGFGEVFDPTAYSDREKNTGIIRSPSLTLFGESVPETFYEALDQGMIGDGLLPRFSIFPETALRSYRNKAADSYVTPEGTIQPLQDLVAYVSGLMQRGEVHRVQWTAEAEAKFDEFDQWTTDEINRGNGEVSRQLWNRANLKAIKFASLKAIGENYLQPVVTIDHTMWATGLVVSQTRNLMDRFETGNVGEQAGNQSLQVRECLRLCNEYLGDAEKALKYHPKRYDIWDAHIIPMSYLTIRMSALAVFHKDRLGAKAAIDRTLKHLAQEIGVLTEVPKSQMLKDWGVSTRAFTIGDPSAIAGGI